MCFVLCQEIVKTFEISEPVITSSQSQQRLSVWQQLQVTFPTRGLHVFINLAFQTIPTFVTSHRLWVLPPPSACSWNCACWWESETWWLPLPPLDSLLCCSYEAVEGGGAGVCSRFGSPPLINRMIGISNPPISFVHCPGRFPYFMCTQQKRRITWEWSQ